MYYIYREIFDSVYDKKIEQAKSKLVSTLADMRYQEGFTPENKDKAFKLARTVGTHKTLGALELIVLPDIKEFEGLTSSQMIEYAKNHAKENYSNLVITNNVDKSQIRISLDGLKHALSKNAGSLNAKIAMNLPMLLKRMTPMSVEKEKNSDPNVVSVTKYGANLVVSGNQVRVMFSIKNYKNGNKFYHSSEWHVWTPK